MCVSIEAMMSKKPSIIKVRKEGVFVQRHIKQAENIQRMVVPHILWCGSYLQSEKIWIPRERME